MKILFISVPAFIYTEDSVSSVLERLKLTVRGMVQLGHTAKILVPEGSEKLNYAIEVPGQLHPNLETCDRYEYLMSPSSSLMGMIEYARIHQDEYDAIISVAQDYMCLWSIPYFKTPFLVIPNTIGSLDECDDLLRRRYQEIPLNFAFLTKNQRDIFFNKKTDEQLVLGEPFEKEQYSFGLEKNMDTIFWAGRVIEYKGLENIAKICQQLGKKLEFSGVVNDEKFLQHLLLTYNCEYLGILNRKQMSIKMAQSPVFFQLQNPPWQEAFGRTTVEALLSGTPVIAFDNGANAELISQDVDGFIVKNISEAIDSYDKAIKLLPSEIVQSATNKFSILRHAQNIEKWLELVLQNRSS